ncbi:MAG TPA: M20/M25/M40 family metallo-hydrolase [Puia sp.]|nr:M20/M25/M40 family metallo-hydrolase [Puia sp.]
MRSLLFILSLATLHTAYSQGPDILRVRSWRQQQEQAILREFVSFLAIPDVAADSVHIQENAGLIEAMMRKRKIGNIQLLRGKEEGFPPAVYGEVLVPGARETIGFYAHYDGQPVNPAQWATGLEPFTPVLFDGSLLNQGKPIPLPASGPYGPAWRIYARGASDDKAGVAAILNAYEALRASGINPTCNLKFLFEGEEEAGSIHLGDIFEAHAPLLRSDCWIICDGPVHQTGRKQIVFGVRGDAHLDLTVYGPKRPLHSGHYGNWANNPALMLAKLLASMKDDSGRVTIKGFYDDVQPLSDVEAKALREVPSVDEQMKQELGVATTEMPGKSLSEAINLPSLNINGIQSGNVGSQASNQIPTYATAVLDLRLVLGNDWQRQQQKVIDHIRAQGYMVLDHDPTDDERRTYPRLIKVIRPAGSYNAQRTSMNLPVIERIRAAIQGTSPDVLVLQPTSGGSLPLYLFEKYLQAPTITVPIANHDNNQHAENENIRLLNLWTGIESMAAIMLMK